MKLLIIFFITFIIAAITLFSGFGTGTVLMPIFAIFFPVNIAIAITAIVHLVNSLFRGILLFKEADKNIIIKFGIPAMFAAIIGAYLLSLLSKSPYIVSFHIFNAQFHVQIIKFIAGLLILFFALIEIIPYTNNLSLSTKYMPIGGILSGFFGGLSGHQGAFRSAFLIKANLPKVTFIGTNMIIAVMIDTTRLLVYGLEFPTYQITNQLPVLLLACIAAILGSYLSSHYIEKVSITFIKILIFIMLLGIGISLIFGLI